MLAWDRPILCLVVDRTICELSLPHAVAEAVRGGVDWIQLRERELPGGELLSWCESLARAGIEAAEESGRRIAVLVNRRIDIALALAESNLGLGPEAHPLGVHLGFNAVSPAVARQLLAPASCAGRASWIGVSTHQPEELRERMIASDNPADYAQLAPIFAPLSKTSSRTPLGLAALERACRDGLSVLAQGGMDADNARQAIEAGAAGIAVTGAILQSSDPRRAALRLRRALDSAQTH